MKYEIVGVQRKSGEYEGRPYDNTYLHVLNLNPNVTGRQAGTVKLKTPAFGNILQEHGKPPACRPAGGGGLPSGLRPMEVQIQNPKTRRSKSWLILAPKSRQTNVCLSCIPKANRQTLNMHK